MAVIRDKLRARLITVSARVRGRLYTHVHIALSSSNAYNYEIATENYLSTTVVDSYILESYFIWIW